MLRVLLSLNDLPRSIFSYSCLPLSFGTLPPGLESPYSSLPQHLLDLGIWNPRVPFTKSHVQTPFPFNLWKDVPPFPGTPFSDSHPAPRRLGDPFPQDLFPQGLGLHPPQTPRCLRLGHEQYSCLTPDPGTPSFGFLRPKYPSIPHCLPNSGVLTARMPPPGATQAPFSPNARPSATSRGTPRPAPPPPSRTPPLVLTSLRAGRTLRAAGPAAA